MGDMTDSGPYTLAAVPITTLAEFRGGRGPKADLHVEGLLKHARDFARKVGFHAENQLAGGSRSVVLKGIDAEGRSAILKTSEPHHVADELIGYRYLDKTRLPELYAFDSTSLLVSYIEPHGSPEPITHEELFKIAKGHSDVSYVELSASLRKGWRHPKLLPFTAALRRRLKGVHGRRADLTPAELRDVELAENIIEEFEHEGVPTSLVHGDFLPKNIHMGADGVYYSLDSSPLLGDESYDLAMYLSWRDSTETMRLWELLEESRLNKMLFVFLSLERPFAKHNAEERDALLDELRPLFEYLS